MPNRPYTAEELETTSYVGTPLRVQYARMMEDTPFFRKLDAALGPNVPIRQKLDAWKVTQEIAMLVMKRTMEDLGR
jgi:hypothetical protein